MAAHLSVVFQRTGKCVRLPPSPYTVSNLDVAVAVGSTCGDGAVTGIILNRKSIEVSVSTDAAFDKLITLAHPIPNTDHVLRFDACYSEQFTVTFYNVPLNATGAEESAIIAAAGGTVLSHTIRRGQTAAGSFNTGERIFLCTGRSNFTALPLAVAAYDGRQLGVRYRGQAAALAKLQTINKSGSALAATSNWADGKDPQKEFDRLIEEEEAERLAGLAAKSQSGAQQTVQPPENPVNAEEPVKSNESPANAASPDNNVVNTEQTTEHTPDPAEDADLPPTDITDPPADGASPVTTDPDTEASSSSVGENGSASADEKPEPVGDPLSAPTSPRGYNGPGYTHPRFTAKKAASDGDRGRSPHRKPKCRHYCSRCDSASTSKFTANGLNEHYKLVHPLIYQTVHGQWVHLRSTDYDSYKLQKKSMTCNQCAQVSLMERPP